MLEVRHDKNSKPYCVCNDCAVQLFIRGKNGIKKFKNLMPNYNCKFKSHKLIELIEYFEKPSQPTTPPTTFMACSPSVAKNATNGSYCRPGRRGYKSPSIAPFALYA